MHTFYILNESRLDVTLEAETSFAEHLAILNYTRMHLSEGYSVWVPAADALHWNDGSRKTVAGQTLGEYVGDVVAAHTA